MLLFIHGRWYDTTGWRHPGGPVALKVGDGRDATASFELHHPFVSRGRLRALLARLEVPAADAAKLRLQARVEREPDFVWATDGHANDPLPPPDAFRADLVATIRGYFEEEACRRGVSLRQAIKATPEHWMSLAVMAVTALALTPSYVNGEVWSVAPLLLLTWMVTASLLHDGSHFAMSTNWKVNLWATHAAPWLASSSTWFVQHVIGHHAHTNIPGRDPDLYHAPHNWRYVAHADWRPRHSLQTLLWPLIWCVATWSTAVTNELGIDYYNGTTKTQPRTTDNYPFYYLLRLAVLAGLLALPYAFQPAWKATLFGFTMWMGLSFTFMLFSQVSHLDQACGNARHSSFWRHQIMTSIDYSNTSRFWCLLSIGLNGQTIHHSFPTINPCHYRALFPLFREVCQRHNVNYQVRANIKEALANYFHTLEVLSVRDEEVIDEVAMLKQGEPQKNTQLGSGGKNRSSTS